MVYEQEPDAERYERHAGFAGPSPAARSGTARSSARRWASRRTSTTPSGSSRTWTPSRRPRARRSSWPPGRTRWRWASLPRPLRHRRMSEPSYPAPSDPADLGFEAIVYEKAPPRATITLNRPEVLNAFDFRMLREIARGPRGRFLGRRDPRGRRHGRGACVLRGRRPEGVEPRLPGQAGRVLEVVRRVQGRPRQAARDRQADARAHQRRLRRGRQRAADGLRPLRHRRRHVHPPRRSPARVGARGRRDAVAPDHGRRAPGARSSSSARRSRPGRPRSGGS